MFSSLQKPQAPGKRQNMIFFEKTCHMAIFCLIWAVFALPKPSEGLWGGCWVATCTAMAEKNAKNVFRTRPRVEKHFKPIRITY